MHDGSLATLNDVVAFYSRGGQENPFLDKEIRPLRLTDAQRRDPVAFVLSLSSMPGQGRNDDDRISGSIPEKPLVG
jgi:cytochrome c peroxidase